MNPPQLLSEREHDPAAAACPPSALLDAAPTPFLVAEPAARDPCFADEELAVLLGKGDVESSSHCQPDCVRKLRDKELLSDVDPFPRLIFTDVSPPESDSSEEIARLPSSI